MESKTITVSDFCYSSSSLNREGVLESEYYFTLRVVYSNKKADVFIYDSFCCDISDNCLPGKDLSRRAGVINVVMRTLESKGYKAEHDDAVRFISNRSDKLIFRK